MAMIKNPFNRGRGIRVNDRYDRMDVVVDNPANDSSRNKLFTNLEKVTTLTQNAWNQSPYTREDKYNKVFMTGGATVGRRDRYKGLINNRGR